MSYRRVATLEEAAEAVRELRLRTVVVDVEPLVASWDTGSDVLEEGVARVLASLEAEVVIFATNSWRKCVSYDGYVANALKPFALARYRSLPRPGAVIGDQVATDGVLARRLGFVFLHYCPALARVPLGPRLMRELGRPLRRLLFRALPRDQHDKPR
jgi:predicted HAD superfamily phosphohydrolase YqeG